MPEDDPDTLQLLDESDANWVKLWRKAARKELKSSCITCVILPMNQQKQKTK